MRSSEPVLVHRDPRALEDAVLDALAARTDPFTQRVRLVVRGGATRVHLAGRLARRAGALVGVRVTTLLGTALEALAKSGTATPPLFDPARDLRLARAAEGDARLAAVLGGLEDGAATAVRAAEELVDAGLVPEQLDALLELCDAIANERARDRSRALIELAARAAPGGDLEGRAAAVFARALDHAALATELDAGTDGARVLLVGCEDARGAEADFTEALVRAGAELWSTVASDAPLARRFEGAARRDDGAPPAVSARRAPDLRSALRDAARTFAARIDAGTAPEDLALVAPVPEAVAVALTDAFDALGVPFSAPGHAAPPRGPARPLAALARVLTAGERAGANAAALAVAGPRGRELAREVVRRGAVGLVDLDAPEFAALASLVAPDSAPRPARDHAAALVRVSRDALAFDTDTELAAAVERACDELADALDAAQVEPSADEWRALLAPSLARAARGPFGGAGGGVQVLAPADARGRAFDTVALVGFARGVFPRALDDDPLLDDALRRALRDLVPDLDAGARRRADDEALLLGLLEAGERVVAIHAERSADGNEALPAPALERRLVDRGASFDAVPVAGSEEDAARGPLPALEWARLFGAASEHAAPKERGAALEHALAPLHTSAAAARAHAASLLDHDGGGDDLGALGVAALRSETGTSDGESDDAPFLTRLERHAVCAWMAHLERDLGVARPADGELVTPDVRHVGTCVHRAVELLLAPDASGTTDASGTPDTRRNEDTDFAALAATRVEVPNDAAIDAALGGAIRHTLERAERDGQLPERLPGAAAWLRARCRPLVERAVDALFEGHPLEVLGVERRGRVVVEHDGAQHAARFIADAALATENGPLLVDLKTGAPDTAKGAGTRTAHVLADLAKGAKLQAGAYAVAAQGRGAYLFLGSEDEYEPERRHSVVDADAAREPLGRALAVLLRTRRAGVALPRLVANDTNDDSVPDACGRCDFVDACVQGDTLWRERQRRWIDARRAAGAVDDDPGAAWFELAKKPVKSKESDADARGGDA